MKLGTVLHEGVPEYFFSPHVTMIQVIHMAWLQISMLNFLFTLAAVWLCYHCMSLSQVQSKECENCDLPKTFTDLMDKAISGGKN